jgi:hypothetical protein
MLMSAASTFKLPVQVLDFEDICLLIQLARLLCGFCSSDQRFACGFLQTPPRDGHLCRPANDSPCRVRRGLSPPSECALPGAQRKRHARNLACPNDQFDFHFVACLLGLEIMSQRAGSKGRCLEAYRCRRMMLLSRSLPLSSEGIPSCDLVRLFH